MTPRSRILAWFTSARLAALVVVFALPLALRLMPLEHGLPRNYVPDTHVVRNALGMARDKDLVPPAGTYTSYPYGISYLLLPLYAGQYALGRATGAWAGAGEFGEHLKEHPEDAHRTARRLVALLGALTAAVVFAIAREVGLRHGAWMAAWLCGTSLLNLQYTTQERAWGPVLFFLVLTAWPATRYARTGRPRLLLVAALCAGLAASCHQSGLWALGLVGLAWAFGPRSEGARPAGPLPRRVALGALAVLLFAGVTLLVGYPFRLVHGATPTAAISGGELAEQAQWHVAIGGQRQALGFEPATIVRMTRAFVGYDLVLAVLAPLGIWRALRPRANRMHAYRAVLVFALVWGAFYWTNPTFYVRYALPLTALLAVPVAALLEDLWNGRRARAAVVVALAFPLVLACRFAYVLARPDTRALAEARLHELPEGALVAIGRHGPQVPLDARGLHLLERIRATPLRLDAEGTQLSEPLGLRAREAHRLAHYDAGLEAAIEPGVPALPLEELLAFEQGEDAVHLRPFAGDPFGSTPLEALRTLGVTHVLLVDLSPATREVGELTAEELVPGAAPLWTVDPSVGAAPAREARLPLELEFPLTSLWSVARPGPRLTLYEL